MPKSLGTIQLLENSIKQTDNQINSTQVANLLGSDDGTLTGTKHQLRVDGNGRASVDINSGIPTKTDGTSGHSPATGIGLIGFEGSTARAVACDSNGNIQVDVVNTANVKFEDISSSLNSGTANDPPNSLAVGLRARQTINDASTETFLKCNASGELLTSGGGGGGGDASAANQTTMISHLSDIETNTTGLATQSTLADAETHLGTIETNTTGLATQSTLADAETHLGTIDTNIANAETHLGNIETNTTGLATQSTLADAETHLGNIDTATSGVNSKLPTLGGKATSGSVSVARSTTTGDWDISARTSINSKATSTFLQCDTDGRLQVDLDAKKYLQDTQQTVHTTGSGNIEYGDWINTDGYTKLDFQLRTTTAAASLGAMITWSNTNTGTAGGELYGYNDGSGTIQNTSNLIFMDGSRADSATTGIYQTGATENPLLAQYFRIEYWYSGGSAPTFDMYYNLYVD